MEIKSILARREPKFGPADFKHFEEEVDKNEVEGYLLILEAMDGLTSEQKRYLRAELEKENHGLFMIFKFFMQSRDSNYFLKRLINASTQRASLGNVTNSTSTPRHSSPVKSSVDLSSFSSARKGKRKLTDILSNSV